MKCSSFCFKLSRNKVIKKLIKCIDDPEMYKYYFYKLFDIYEEYKSNRYNQEQINKMFDAYLSKKGLINLSDKDKEDKYTIDNYVLLELKNKYEDMNIRISDLQELILSVIDELNKVKSKKDVIISKRKDKKVRSKIEVS